MYIKLVTNLTLFHYHVEMNKGTRRVCPCAHVCVHTLSPNKMRIVIIVKKICNDTKFGMCLEKKEEADISKVGIGSF